MNTAFLVEELKKQLKKRGITYAALAAKVGLSEPAIKRAFAARNFSLQRLDQFCDACHIDLAELVLATRRAEKTPKQFTADQEEELAADAELLHLLYLVLLKVSPARMRRQLGRSAAHVYLLARRLEELGLIEVLPGEKLQALIRKSVRWRPNGPLSERYGRNLQQAFFASKFDRPDEHQDFLTGTLSASSYQVLKRKMDELFRQFDELSDLDAEGGDAAADSYWFYAGIRPWAPLAVVAHAATQDG